MDIHIHGKPDISAGDWPTCPMTRSTPATGRCSADFYPMPLRCLMSETILSETSSQSSRWDLVGN